MDSLPSTSTVRHFSRLPDHFADCLQANGRETHLKFAGAQFYCTLSQRPSRWPKMQSWSKITHYAGFDWAHDHHDVVIVNGSGKIVADFQIEHTAQGWQRWREQVAALADC